MVGLAGCAVLFAMKSVSHAVAPPHAVVQTPGAPLLAAASSGTKPVARRVYPYSIVPGGVANRAELLSVVRTDRVVSEHYATFDVAKAYPVTVAKARAVHVSYRKGDKVYWTKKKLMLVEGETLLSDGANEMRARCANRISDVAQFPVEADEPSAEMLDASFEADLPEGESAALVQTSGPETSVGEEPLAADGSGGNRTLSQFQSAVGAGETGHAAQAGGTRPDMFGAQEWGRPTTGLFAARGPRNDTGGTDLPAWLLMAKPVSWIDDPALARAVMPAPADANASLPPAVPDPRPFIPATMPTAQAPIVDVVIDQPRPTDIPEPGTPWLVAAALALILSLRRHQTLP